MAKNSFNGELLHFGSVRMRVTGIGGLDLTLASLDSTRTSTLPSITMAVTTNREPLVLANFREQRAQLVGQTTGIDEVYNISKIVIYIKPTASGYPQ